MAERVDGFCSGKMEGDGKTGVDCKGPYIARPKGTAHAGHLFGSPTLPPKIAITVLHLSVFKLQKYRNSRPNETFLSDGGIAELLGVKA